MSKKISAKDLHYDTTLPPFLARLRGQAASGGAGDGPDPLLVRNRRHAKPRSGSAEAEDAPLVVDGDGNVVQGLSVGADGAVTEGDTSRGVGEQTVGAEEAGKAGDAVDEAGGEEVKEREKIAAIGGEKKRKVGKVVGADEGEARDTRGEAGKGRDADGEGKPAAAAKKKKKAAKKIKLSFGDDDG